jgi:hypothetical protein
VHQTAYCCVLATDLLSPTVRLFKWLGPNIMYVYSSSIIPGKKTLMLHAHLGEARFFADAFLV